MSDDLLGHHDALLADLDGTLYRGPVAVPGAVDAIRGAADRGVPTVYVTNNASRSPSDVAGQLADLGFPAREQDVRTSAQAGAAMLAELVADGAAVLVVGTGSLADLVRERGLRVVTGGDDADAVIQGHSPDTGWRLLAEATVAVRGGAVWVATNVDPTLPTERGTMPGNGSMVGVVRIATGAEPRIAGKPAARLLTEAQAAASSTRPLVVGDRLDTDIEGAVAAGAPSLLVMTGVSTADDLVRAAVVRRPTYVGADMAALTRPVDELTPGEKGGWTARPDGDAVVLAGNGDDLDALRTLCPVAWGAAGDGGFGGPVRADGDAAGDALARLGLA